MPAPIFEKRYLNFFIKALLLTLLAWAIYAQLLSKDNLPELWKTFLGQVQKGNLWWLFAVFFLMPLNWSIEALKWKRLLGGFLKIDFWRALRAVLAGVTVAMFTPNRVGEYGGRILLVDAEYNWRAIVATLVGSFSQLLALLCAGLFGLSYFGWRFMGLENMVVGSLLFFGASLIGLLLIMYFNINLLLPLARKLAWLQRFKKYLKHLKVLRLFTSGELFGVLLLSFARYLVYSLQFFFMLRFLGVQSSFFVAMAGIFTIFLVQTTVPLPPVMGLMARGQIALFVWSFFGANELSILAATYAIFVINLALPALLGALIIVRINVLKSLGYENHHA